MNSNPTGLRMPTNLRELARYFDHTNLNPDATQKDIRNLCLEAHRHLVCAVCVAPRWVRFVTQILDELRDEKVQVCSVVGFPHGNTTSETKAYETSRAIGDGATEIDMVISIGDLKDREEQIVANDIAGVVQVAHSSEKTVKVILETSYLTVEEIISGCQIAIQCGADFVKTSTGFGPGGATVEAVRLMRQTVKDKAAVKAAGGIRTLSEAREMIEAGASRLGCSSSVKILQDARDNYGWKF